VGEVDAAAEPRPSSVSTIATVAPSAVNRRTVASPMPDAPPVTTATFPASVATPGSLQLRERAAQCAYGLSDAVLVLDQGEAHVSLTAGPEADAR
jgi:hypothetical protein